jgi:hypothetical protein
MNIYIYMYIQAYMCICMCTYTCIYLHLCIFMYICISFLLDSFPFSSSRLHHPLPAFLHFSPFPLPIPILREHRPARVATGGTRWNTEEEGMKFAVKTSVVLLSVVKLSNRINASGVLSMTGHVYAAFAENFLEYGAFRTVSCPDFAIFLPTHF